MTNEDAINALTMCQELMLFDPTTGETHELWQENKDNQDLYNACTAAITALREQSERDKGCEHCTKHEEMAYGIDGLQREAYIYIDGNTLTADLYSESMAVAICFCPVCGKRLDKRRESEVSEC